MFDWAYFLNSFWAVVPGVHIAFFLTIFSFFFGGILGLVLSLIRIFKIKFLNQVVIIYVSFFRGTPLLVQLFMFYYGLPIFLKSLDININILSIDGLYYAMFVFCLYASSYLCEIFRAAFLSVDKGQLDAAYSIGMSYKQALFRILLPQALMITLPNLLNFFIMQLKNTSLASIIAVGEIMGLADIESGRSSKFLEVYLMAALLYWAICVILEWIFSFLEKYFLKFRREFAR